MPAQLTNVEAQRIIAILEETYTKLSLLSHVPPLRRVPNFEAFQDEVGPEVAQVLDEQVLLEQQYKWVSTPQHEQPEAEEPGRFEGDQTLPDFETLDDELRHSTRVVCRMLREAPGISSHLQELGDQSPSAAIRKFLSTCLELKLQTFQKLSTSVEEEKSKEDWFLEISAREEKASQTLRQLQKEIKAEKAERERQVSARQEMIQKLREELELIKTSTLAEERQLDAETKASEVRASPPKSCPAKSPASYGWPPATPQRPSGPAPLSPTPGNRVARFRGALTHRRRLTAAHLRAKRPHSRRSSVGLRTNSRASAAQTRRPRRRSAKRRSNTKERRRHGSQNTTPTWRCVARSRHAPDAQPPLVLCTHLHLSIPTLTSTGERSRGENASCKLFGQSSKAQARWRCLGRPLPTLATLAEPRPCMRACTFRVRVPTQISALRLIYEEERKELTRLETYFDQLMAEREAALALERKKAEERARQQAQMATLSKAATMLQKIWRGKQGRKAAEKGKAGKGGKKKK